jgi:hypothetical protein
MTLRDPIHPWLASIAAGEVARREARDPAKIADRAAAAADLSAWRAIAALLAEGSAETSLSWAELIHAARIQFDALARPTGGVMSADPAKAERLGAVEAIFSRLEWHQAQAMARPSEQGRAAA